MKLKQQVFTIAAVILYMGLVWVGAYYFTAWSYRRLEWEPPELARHLITGALGFFLWGATMATVGSLMRPKQSHFFYVMLDAIRRIAKGDFSVQIDTGRQAGVFTELVDGINHMAGELGQMEKLRQEFISNVSHEIQSPLASIGGFARTLQSDSLEPEERRRYLSIIETECSRLSKLSDNLMKLTSLESEHHPFELKPYRLDKQLRGLILMLEPQWSGKDIEMEAELAEVTAEADEELMSQVWVNLIHNSIKFTPQGGMVSVRLEGIPEGGAVVTVADTGIGIAPEDRAHIFERFYKADKSRNRSLGGSGLGLAIVRRIMDKHGGAVRVDGDPGCGTVITVVLPGPAPKRPVQTAEKTRIAQPALRRNRLDKKA
jgi:two-component system, OmpR family, phosphate regulon sensor histidine kinase PhoR